MKLVTYGSRKSPRVGVVEGNVVVDVQGLVELASKRRLPRTPSTQALLKPGPAPRDMIELLSRGKAWCKALAAVARSVVEAPSGAKKLKPPKGLFVPLKTAKLLAPIPRPSKILCVGLNYADHAHEQGKEPPTSPIFFLKSVNTINAPGGPVQLPSNSSQVDYEAEFAVVIGKGGKNISEEKAFEHVAGYTILNDVSARDLQFSDKQWYRGKSCDTFAPTGPWIVTTDEVPDPHNLRISLDLNGRTMQDSNTCNLIFKVPFLIWYLSQSVTLEAGDLISTGTPPGVGVFRDPKVFLKPGDSMSVTVEHIGTLTNHVVKP